MPRYFFHVHDGKDMPDNVGTNFPNDEAAENEAVVLAGEMLKELDGDFWNESNWRLEVLDESGAQVCQLEVLANSRRH
jgi:hypothetical protein